MDPPAQKHPLEFEPILSSSEVASSTLPTFSTLSLLSCLSVVTDEEGETIGVWSCGETIANGDLEFRAVTCGLLGRAVASMMRLTTKVRTRNSLVMIGDVVVLRMVCPTRAMSTRTQREDANGWIFANKSFRDEVVGR